MPEKRKTTYRNSEMEYAHREGLRLKEDKRKAQWEAELKAIKKRREEQRRKEDRGITYAPKRRPISAGSRSARPRRSPPRPR